MPHTHTHGPLHDNFRAHPGEPHGGAEFDTGFNAMPGHTHGEQHDAGFRSSGTAGTAKGALYDQFGEWKALPDEHGYLFDGNFNAPAALDGGEHGTWHDVFRGAEVKVVIGGGDFEASVIRTADDHAVVKLRDGRETEVALQQIRALRHVPGTSGEPSRSPSTAEPGDTPTGFIGASSAHAPSAHDAKASGGRLNANRTEVDPGMAASATNKCAECDDHGYLIALGEGGVFKGARICECEVGKAITVEEVVAKVTGTVRKAVDSTETAVQARDEEAPTGQPWCPKCRHVCRDAEPGGKCPTCGTKVTVKKDWTAALDVLKAGDAPKAPACPDCGGKNVTLGLHDSAKCPDCFHSFKASDPKPPPGGPKGPRKRKPSFGVPK